MKKELFIKFLNNRCTSAELEEFVRWANNTEAFEKEGYKLGIQDWELYQPEEGSLNDDKFIGLFDKIQYKIGTDITNLEIETGRSKSTISVFKTWLTRAAAVLLIPVLSFLFYTLSELKTETAKYANLAVDSLEVIAPLGARTVVQLPDGSKVHLNYGSTIKYPQIFSGNTRDVKLTGEGYFDVAHNPEKPFVVKTANLNIKALGTVFNVLAYSDKENIETTLVRGKVVLEQNTVNGKIKNIGYMVPGQHVDFDVQTGAINSKMGNIEKYIAWKDGKLVFEDASITQVVEQLDRIFNVDIEIAGDMSDCIYTVTFVNESLLQILDLMTIATPIRYKTFQRKKLPDGTFSKQKVIIERENKN